MHDVHDDTTPLGRSKAPRAPGASAGRQHDGGRQAGADQEPLVSPCKFACYNPDGIWGVGDTRDQARYEGEGFLKDKFADQRDTALARMLGSLEIAPIDDGLLQDVIVHGPGFPLFALHGGRLVFCDGPADADAIDEAEVIAGGF